MERRDVQKQDNLLHKFYKHTLTVYKSQPYPHRQTSMYQGRMSMDKVLIRIGTLRPMSNIFMKSLQVGRQKHSKPRQLLPEVTRLQPQTMEQILFVPVNLAR